MFTASEFGASNTVVQTRYAAMNIYFYFFPLSTIWKAADEYTGLIADIFLFILSMINLGFAWALLLEYKTINAVHTDLHRQVASIENMQQTEINKLNESLDILAFMQRRDEPLEKLLSKIQSEKLLTNYSDILKKFNELGQEHKLISAKISDMEAANKARMAQLGRWLRKD